MEAFASTVQRGKLLGYLCSLLLRRSQVMRQEQTDFRKGKISMCDEEHIAAQLKRNHGEGLIANLTRDIAAFFAQKYETSSCRFQRVVPQEEDMAQVDFTVSRESEFTRRYVGSAGYVDGHLSLEKVIRLM